MMTGDNPDYVIKKKEDEMMDAATRRFWKVMRFKQVSMNWYFMLESILMRRELTCLSPSSLMKLY